MCLRWTSKLFHKVTTDIRCHLIQMVTKRNVSTSTKAELMFWTARVFVFVICFVPVNSCSSFSSTLVNVETVHEVNIWMRRQRISAVTSSRNTMWKRIDFHPRGSQACWTALHIFQNAKWVNCFNSSKSMLVTIKTVHMVTISMGKQRISAANSSK